MNQPYCRQVRDNLGLTLREFSDQFGISYGTILGWEYGGKQPSGCALLLLRCISANPAMVRHVAGFKDDPSF